MAWNEPGKNDNDPWGNNSRGKNDGPPDFDELLRRATNKLTGLFGGGGGGNNNSEPSSLTPFIALACVLAVLVWVGSGFRVVNEQERAVVLRLGSYLETVGPGFRWNPPLIDRVLTENVTRVRLFTTDEQMLTKDLNIVDIKLSVQYRIQDARSFILNVDQPEKTLEQATSSALRHVVGTTLMHNVLTEGRAQLAVDVEHRLQTYLGNYTTGIDVEKVNIEDSNPPKEVQTAFDDVIRAREDEERFKNVAQTYSNDVIPSAGGAAKRMVEEAMAYSSKVISEAEGEAKRFELLLAEYTKAPEVTRKRLYIDALEEVMSKTTKVIVDVDKGNNMMYLPLDKLIDAAPKPQASGRPGMSASDLETITNQVLERFNREVNTSRRGGR
ncbi:MAG TPA: FtsH protease activity modulator HflK [Cellvibrionaceae bacterium]